MSTYEFPANDCCGAPSGSHYSDCGSINATGSHAICGPAGIEAMVGVSPRIKRDILLAFLRNLPQMDLGEGPEEVFLCLDSQPEGFDVAALADKVVDACLREREVE